MKILVTGAAGYVGSVLCGELLERGDTVVGVDRLLHGGRSIMAYQENPRFKLLATDINDTDSFESFLDEETSIVHLAAIVGDPASKKMPEETVRTNIDGTKKLIDIAIKKRVSKFVFVSTCSNYGCIPDGMMAKEEDELNPLSLYASTKVEMENYLQKQVGSQLNWTVLRFSTIHGLSPRPRFDLTVNDFTMHALIDGKLKIFLPGSTRPYLHVTDAARAVVMCLDKKRESTNEIFNVGDNSQNFKKIEIVEAIKKHIGEFEVEYVDRGNDPRSYSVNFDKIHAMLGYEIKKQLHDGIAEIVEAVNKRIIKDYENPEYYNA